MKKINYRKVVLMLADFCIMLMAGVASYFILSSFGLPADYIKRIMLATGVAAICTFCTLAASGVYLVLWRYVSGKDYFRCFIGTSIGTLFSWAITVLLDKPLTPQFWPLYFAFSTLGISIFRICFKETFLVIEKSGEEAAKKKRTLIVGAGKASKMIISEMTNNEGNCEYLPVCIVDDDITKLNTKLYNTMVEGTTEDIPSLCKSQNIDTIMFAIPSSTEKERKRILDICNETKLEIKIIPYLSDMLFQEDVSLLSQVKDINIEDLLGRDPITFDKNDVHELINDKVILVTGGGGSIGSELCRQIVKYKPKQLIILDIYENNAYEIQQELIMEYGNTINLVTLISSVRDYNKMKVIFEKYRPDIVFHAAAHKHVPLMETVPEEAVKNNVIGTFNCVTLADFYKVSKFVLISTDKAVNPTNVMGATKRCCEMIVQYYSQQSEDTDFIAVRFGNVLGSNGSVIPLFKKQIESGKPVTVTHPDINRFFMTIPEAVSLVMQAGAIAKGGEIFVLDMGEPVKIITLAENLIRQYGKKPYKDVKIKFTGLRPGEKLYEELLMSEEGLESTAKDKIFIGNQIEIHNDFMTKLYNLKKCAIDNDSFATEKILSDIVPTFNHLKHSSGKIIVENEKISNSEIKRK